MGKGKGEGAAPGFTDILSKAGYLLLQETTNLLLEIISHLIQVHELYHFGTKQKVIWSLTS